MDDMTFQKHLGMSSSQMTYLTPSFFGVPGRLKPPTSKAYEVHLMIIHLGEINWWGRAMSVGYIYNIHTCIHTYVHTYLCSTLQYIFLHTFKHIVYICILYNCPCTNLQQLLVTSRTMQRAARLLRFGVGISLFMISELENFSESYGSSAHWIRWMLLNIGTKTWWNMMKSELFYSGFMSLAAFQASNVGTWNHLRNHLRDHIRNHLNMYPLVN